MTGHLPYLAFWTPGPLELIVILAVLVLLFGRKLPEIARSVGKSFTEFKRGINEAKETKDEIIDDVRKAKDEAIQEVKDAAELNDLDEND